MPADTDTKHSQPTSARLVAGTAIENSLRLIDFVPMLALIIVALVVGGTSSFFDATRGGSLFDSKAWQVGVMAVSAALAVIGFYITYRAAKRTTEREVLRAWASDLLGRLDDLERDPSPSQNHKDDNVPTTQR